MALWLLTACDRQPDQEAASISLPADASCDVAPGCSVAINDFSVDFLIGPEPRALRSFAVRARIPDDASITAIAVEFVMVDMQMGMNRYRLVPQSNRTWRADVTLPVCVSGRSDWIAQFELLSHEGRTRVDIPFSLER
ncbi:MAG: hypothetical protein RQ736_09085 [Thiogranum sp.]|nr:hypothetical protein [Thiogranum sp.]